jgi:hypothetical protein
MIGEHAPAEDDLEAMLLPEDSPERRSDRDLLREYHRNPDTMCALCRDAIDKFLDNSRDQGAFLVRSACRGELLRVQVGEPQKEIGVEVVAPGHGKEIRVAPAAEDLGRLQQGRPPEGPFRKVLFLKCAPRGHRRE